MPAENDTEDNLLSTSDSQNTVNEPISQEPSVLNMNENEDISSNDIVDQLKEDKQVLAKRVDDKEKWISHLQSKYDQLQNSIRQEPIGSTQDVNINKVVPAPHKDDFDSSQEYVDHLVKWEKQNSQMLENIVKKHMEKAKAREDEVVSREGFEKKSADIRGLVSDFDEIAKSETINNIYLNSTNNLASIIQNHPNGPEYAYFLGKNLNIAGELATLPVHKLFARLSEISPQIKIKTQNISSAPYPVIPGKNSSSKSSKDPGEMEMSEYMAWHNRDR